MSRTAEVLVQDGGQLRTQPSISIENVGPANFTRLLNLRRVEKDQLGRREGWFVFRPNAGQPASQQYVYDGAEIMTRQAELVRGDGTRIEVAASLTKIKYFDTATATWVQIGSGFSALGKPWQAVALSSVLVLNNTVDLPTTYEIGDAAVKPLYEAREQGIASAGRIAEYNGFLFLGDVVEIQAEQLAPWINGYTNYTTTSTVAKATDFSIVLANHRTQFNVTTGATDVVATLPSLPSMSARFFIWIKKVDAGAGVVTTDPEILNQTVVLSAINDSALVFWNGFKWVATVFPGGVIPATDPYGIVPVSIQQAIPDEQVWSDFGQPKNFAPFIFAVRGNASTQITMPFVPFNWKANVTRVAVTNAGDGGGTLGGQSAYPEGILITDIGTFDPSILTTLITLEVTTDINLTYPRQVGVTRWTDVSTSAGKQRMGNGSRITAMFPLNGIQIVSHEHGFWTNRYTAVAESPFALRFKYEGENVPMAGDCITGYNTDFVIYPTKARRFYQFDGVSDPVVHQALDDAKDRFFLNLTDSMRIWAVNNALTGELWFLRPDYILAFSYSEDAMGCGEIDAQIDAACEVMRPAANEKWFTLGIANLVMVYGLVNGVVVTWFRNTVAAYPKYTSGLQSMNAQAREKMLYNYTPLFSGSSSNTACTVQLRGTHNANAALTDLLVPIETLPTPVGRNFIPCFFQQTYFQDEVTVVDARDVDFRISGRIYEFDTRAAPGVTRYT